MSLAHETSSGVPKASVARLSHGDIAGQSPGASIWGCKLSGLSSKVSHVRSGMAVGDSNRCPASGLSPRASLAREASLGLPKVSAARFVVKYRRTIAESECPRRGFREV